MVRSQQWTSVTVVNMKSPSFVSLTSEVRVLFVASCFEVCSQQYGQCLFVSHGPDCPTPNYLAQSLGNRTLFGTLLIIFIETK